MLAKDEIVSVDGKAVLTVPPIDSDEPPREWLLNQRHRLHLRWDTHEIRVAKKWYVTGDWRPEASGTVTLDWLDPMHLFKGWKMEEKELVPLIRIVSGRVLQDDIPGHNASAPPTAPTENPPDPVRPLIASWDADLQAALTDAPDPLSDLLLKPFVVRVEARINPDKSGTLAFGIFDLKGQQLQPFLPISLPDVGDKAALEQARDDIFRQLENELQIRGLRAPAAIASADDATTAIQMAADALRSEPLEKSVASTEAALLPIGEFIGSRTVRGAQSAAVHDSLWNSAAVATEALRLGKPESAAAVAEGISKVGEAAAKVGNLQVAAAAQASLQQIAETPAAPGPASPATAGQIAAAQERVTQAIQSVNAQGATRNPRVYFHIAGETQRAAAQKLATALKAAGYIIPGIQNTLGRAYTPPQTEVRYFDASAKDRAELIASQLVSAGGPAMKAVYNKPTARDIAISSDITTHFEIWFSRNWP